MAYEIRYSDLSSVRTQIVAYSNTVRTQLADLQQTYSALMTSGCMTGETAKTLNTYIAYVHEVILSMIDSMLQEYVDKLLAYEDGLRKIEGNRNAILFEAEMERLSDALTRAKKKYGGITGDVSSALGSVSDIYSHTAPSITGINDGYDKTKKIADQLKQDVGSYEHKHRKDCSGVQKYITQINRLLVKHQNYEGGTINIDYIKGLVTGDEIQELLKLQESTSKFSESNQIAIEKGYELMKTEMEEEAAKQREIDGAFKVLTGVVVVSSIVLTGGAAAPAVLVLEAGAVAYGAAEITEGVQDVYYGANGDTTTAAINPLRDSIFFGNQTAYEAFGLVTTVGSAGGAQLAKEGVEITSKNLLKAAAKEEAKNLASDFVGQKAGDVAGCLGANDGQRQLVSILAGLGTGYGLDKVDALKVKAPKYSGLGEMSGLEGKKYEDFLKNGSKSGLTEVEINAAKKAEAQLTLNKIDYDEVLKLRNEKISGSKIGSEGVSNPKSIPDEFYKNNGGMDKADTISIHAEKHLYNPEVISTKKKTQFGKDIDILKLREDTMLHPDSIVYNDEQNVIKYVKEYDFNISTPDTPTGQHRVFINLSPKAGKTNRNSQFPLYTGGN